MTMSAFSSTPLALCLVVASFAMGGRQRSQLVVLSHNALAYAGHPDSVWITNEALVRRGAEFYRSHDPDILVIQEAPEEPSVALLATLLGYEYVWFSPGGQGSASYPYGFPGAVLSRYPMRDAHDYNVGPPDKPNELFERYLGSVIVETPAGPVFVLATHLCADWGGQFRQSTRMAEVEYIESTVDFCDRCPLNVWAADFNFEPGSPPYRSVLTMGFRDADGAPNEHPTVPVPDGAVKIDHIFYRGEDVEVVDFQVLQMPYYDDLERFLSDHHAVRAVLRF